MDNRINEIRKKIRILRTQMLEADATIHGQIGRDEDCSETSLGLMAMRAAMAELSRERAKLGDDREPIMVERFMNPRRPLVPKPVARFVKRHLTPAEKRVR